jgi:hypothetical protein
MWKIGIIMTIEYPIPDDSDNNDSEIYNTDEPVMDDICPSCGNEYDEIDYEYQICHLCKSKNKHKLKVVKEKRNECKHK